MSVFIFFCNSKIYKLPTSPHIPIPPHLTLLFLRLIVHAYLYEIIPVKYFRNTGLFKKSTEKCKTRNIMLERYTISKLMFTVVHKFI